MKKKIVTVGIVIGMVAVLFGCGAAGTDSSNKEKKGISIVTTMFYQYDFAKQILDDKGHVEMLIRPGQESHSFEPSPADVIKIQNADVFIYNGGVMEDWVKHVLEGIDQSKVKVICMMDSVDTVEEELVEGMEEEDEEEHTGDSHKHTEQEAKEYDEHIWASPVNSQKLLQTIAKEIETIDPENKTYYEENKTAYNDQLKELDQDFRKVVDDAKQKTIVFADRFPLRYFAEEYGLDYYAAFPGCSTETEPSPRTIKFLIDKIKTDHIPVVYYLELSNQKIADTLCETTKAKKLEFHSCHNVTNDELKDGATYVSLMEQNVKNLKQGLE